LKGLVVLWYYIKYRHYNGGWGTQGETGIFSQFSLLPIPFPC